jgi:hypothetical protein
MKKLLLFIFAALLLAGCTEMTIDTDLISSQVSLNPSYVIAFSGDVTLGDLIQPGDTILEPRDTILFDNEGLMKIFFYKDSVIDISVDDFYSGFPEEPFSGTYGVLSTGEEAIEETIDIDPGMDIELKSMKIINGEIRYSIASECDFPVSFLLTFTSIIDETQQAIEQTIAVGAHETVNGVVNLDNSFVDFTLDSAQPFNRIKVNGLVTPGGTGTEPLGMVDLEISVPEPEYDYITGYFGMQSEGQENDTIDLGLGDIFGINSNAFYLSDPAIRINYLNSFGVPMQVTADITGIDKDGIETDLARAPEDLLYPTTIETREVESTFIIDNSNSNLSDLISMFPNEIIFGGSATTNPLGDTGADNIVFSDSRLLAGLEVEVPMIFWMNNLVFSDTIDNFLMADDEGDSPLDMLENLELRMFIDNGFPMGGEFSITLFDSASGTPMSVLETGNFFDPAPVDADGIVTSSIEKSTLITLSDGFMEDGPVADKMIISFKFNTTGSGSQDVKIMSDYSISFRAGLLIQVGFETYLNNDENEE